MWGFCNNRKSCLDVSLRAILGNRTSMTSRVICIELDSTGEQRRSTMELYTLNRACSSLLRNRFDKNSISSLDADMVSREPTNDSNRMAKAKRKRKNQQFRSAHWWARLFWVSTLMGETSLDHHSTYRDRRPRFVPLWRSWLNNTSIHLEHDKIRSYLACKHAHLTHRVVPQ